METVADSFFVSRLKIYKELSKSGIVALVLISVLGGYFIGHPFESNFHFSRLLLTLLGVFFLASGSSALNQIQERDLDADMPRTAKRPLPSGRISVSGAALFAVGGILLGTGILMQLDPSLCILGGLAVISYNGLYTLWWKKRMAYAAVPGAIPGALPILMGYASAYGQVLSPGGLYLFFILFFWQMPHFWVLALRYREDYRKGGFPTLPVAHGSGVTVYQISLWCLAYIAVAFMAHLFLGVGRIYYVICTATSLKLLWELRQFARQPESKRWLHFFLWVNFSLIIYIAAAALDLWSVYATAYFR